MAHWLGRRIVIASLLFAAAAQVACGEEERAGAGGGGGLATGGVGATGGASGGSAGTAVGGSAGSAGALNDAGVGGAAGASSDAAATSDYQTFQDVLAGKLGAQAGLVAIAQSEGFPIQVPQGYLFARLDDGKGPYRLAGDHDGWAGAAMTAEAGVYWIVVAVPNPDGSKYKFVDPSDQYAADPYSRCYGYDTYGEFSLVRSTADHLERWPEIGNTTIPVRTIRARVPALVATHHLYVHDGQNLFDPKGPFGSWKLDESLGPKTLAIGIDNAGAARMDEYTHVQDDLDSQPGGAVGGQGDAYSDYVRDVVRPFIEKKFGKPQRVGVMGSSLGGLISFHEALRNPGLWDFAASLSGTFGWGSINLHNETLIERYQKAQKLGTKLYLDSGGGPGSGCVDSDSDGIDDDTPDAADNYCETVQLRDVLSSKGYVFDKDVWHWWESGAAHDEAAWAARVFRPVQIFEAL